MEKWGSGRKGTNFARMRRRTKNDDYYSSSDDGRYEVEREHGPSLPPLSTRYRDERSASKRSGRNAYASSERPSSDDDDDEWYGEEEEEEGVDGGGGGGNENDARAESLFKEFENFIYRTFENDQTNKGVGCSSSYQVTGLGVLVSILNVSRDNRDFREKITSFDGALKVEIEAIDTGAGVNSYTAHLFWPKRQHRGGRIMYEKRYGGGGGKGLIDQPKVIISAMGILSILAFLTTDISQWRNVGSIVGLW